MFMVYFSFTFLCPSTWSGTLYKRHTLFKRHTIEHEIIPYIKILHFWWGRKKLQKHNVVIMHRGDLSLSSGTTIKAIDSVVAEKIASKVQDYEKIMVFFSGCEVLMVSTLGLSHLWWTLLNIMTWMSFQTKQNLNHHFATTQVSSSKKNLAWSPVLICRSSKITCSKIAWDLQFVKSSCSKFCNVLQ